MSLTMASRQLCIPSSSLEGLVYQEFTVISQYLAIVTTSSLFYGEPDTISCTVKVDSMYDAGLQVILFVLSTYIMA